MNTEHPAAAASAGVLERMVRLAVVLASMPLALTAPGQACIMSPSGLAAWWSGDGHFYDLVGTNHGTPVGGTRFVAEAAGRAFAFATTDGWVNFPLGTTDDRPLTTDQHAARPNPRLEIRSSDF